MKPEIAANQALWDKWAEMHLTSESYDVKAFRSGSLSLKFVERKELGNVQNKKILHLQCHFGLDTLSWARLGADVTGVDFSHAAIDRARLLAKEVGIKAHFICAAIEELVVQPAEPFDIVFTSYGVLSWISDLTLWARAIADRLKPGGVFYMVEFHPVLGMLDEEGRALKYSYFHYSEPVVSEETTSYAGAKHAPMKCYQWNYSLGDVVSVLTDHGLRINFLHEFPFTLHACYPFLVESRPGQFLVRDYPHLLPLLFSLKATK